jgi:hypothetical protein
MSDYGDDEDPYKVDRGYKTDSYILAVQGNPIQIQPIPPQEPSTSKLDMGMRQPKARTQVPLLPQSKVESSREVYEAYIVSVVWKLLNSLF